MLLLLPRDMALRVVSPVLLLTRWLLAQSVGADGRLEFSPMYVVTHHRPHEVRWRHTSDLTS